LIDDPDAREAVFDKLPATKISPLSSSAAEWREFNRELIRMTPRAWVTNALVFLNAAMFALLLIVGARFWNAQPELLAAWGANSTPLTTNGQSWRLISAMFLHGGFVHLLLNMWTLWGVGRLTERLYGNALFAAIYLCAGVIASLSSIAWRPFIVTVGASGAIFGVLGACLAFFLRSRMHVPRSIAWRHGVATAVFILFNLVSGFMSEGVDNAAHVGGLLAGFVLGLLLARPVEEGERTALAPLRVVLATAFTAVAIGGGFWQMHIMAANRPAPTQYWAAHAWFLEGQAKALRAQAELQAAATAGTLSPSLFAARFEPEVFVFWRDAYEKLKAEPEPQDEALKEFGAEVIEFARRRHEWASEMLAYAKTERPGHLRDAVYYLGTADESAARLNRHELRAISDPSHALSESRLVRYLRKLPSRFTWECVSRQAAPMKGKRTDGIAALRATGCDAQRAFDREEFAMLEAMLHPAQGELVAFDDGGSRVEGVISGLEELFDGTAAPGPALALLARWRQEFPLSDGPDLIEALLFRSAAWRVRGHGYASDVSPQAWAMYKQSIEMAAGALADAADKDQRSPAYYALAIMLGLDQSKDPGVLQRELDFSLEDFPDYFPPHRAMLRALMPRWGGSFPKVDAYVAHVEEKVPEERRGEMYARLYTMFARLEGDQVDLFSDTAASWPKMKAGYEDILDRYPNSEWLRNMYAQMACRAKDAETYRAVIAELGDRVLPEAWEGKYTVALCDEHVKST
jgi:membrane associated rhomboid family serine protease